MSAVTDRWDAFLQKIRERAVETLTEAELGCAELLDATALDPLPLLNAWTAIDNQLRELCEKVQETFGQKVEPSLDDPREAFREHAKGEALTSWIEAEGERVRTTSLAEAATRILAAARSNAEKELRCSQCGAGLAVPPQFFRSRHVACEFCKSVNTYIPGAQAASVEWFCCHHLSHAEAGTRWAEWVLAERRMRGADDDDVESVKEAERALEAYLTAYLRARIELIPELAPDFDKELKGRMAAFYAEAGPKLRLG